MKQPAWLAQKCNKYAYQNTINVLYLAYSTPTLNVMCSTIFVWYQLLGNHWRLKEIYRSRPHENSLSIIKLTVCDKEIREIWGVLVQRV